MVFGPRPGLHSVDVRSAAATASQRLAAAVFLTSDLPCASRTAPRLFDKPQRVSRRDDHSIAAGVRARGRCRSWPRFFPNELVHRRRAGPVRSAREWSGPRALRLGSGQVAAHSFIDVAQGSPPPHRTHPSVGFERRGERAHRGRRNNRIWLGSIRLDSCPASSHSVQ